MNTTLRMAVIGTGHIGRHHARNLGGLDGVELVAVCDPDEGRGRQAAEMGNSRWVKTPDELPGDLDGVCIAAPTPLHGELAERFLGAGVHCLVEKPLAATPDEAARIVGAAHEAGRIVQVGHIERFNPVFDQLDPDSVRPTQIDCWRLAPHTGRSTDTSVVFDLMIHDLDLVLWWADSPVTAVEASGGIQVGPLEDWASARVSFESGCRAHVTASRVAPTAVRRSVLHGAELTADIDFGQRKLGLHGAAGSQEHQGSDEEPLRRQLAHFVDCVRQGRRPLVAGEDGQKAVELAARVLSCLREAAG